MCSSGLCRALNRARGVGGDSYPGRRVPAGRLPWAGISRPVGAFPTQVPRIPEFHLHPRQCNARSETYPAAASCRSQSGSKLPHHLQIAPSKDTIGSRNVAKKFSVATCSLNPAKQPKQGVRTSGGSRLPQPCPRCISHRDGYWYITPRWGF